MRRPPRAGTERLVDALAHVADQFRKFVPKSDDPVDPPPADATGNLAVAESTAENGGLRIAFRALMDALMAQGRAADTKGDGYTESQRFFLSFAQLSCENQHFSAARQSLSANPHSVGQVCVNIAVQNFEEFGKAFQCARGQPAPRAIWRKREAGFGLFEEWSHLEASPAQKRVRHQLKRRDVHIDALLVNEVREVRIEVWILIAGRDVYRAPVDEHLGAAHR